MQAAGELSVIAMACAVLLRPELCILKRATSASSSAEKDQRKNEFGGDNKSVSSTSLHDELASQYPLSNSCSTLLLTNPLILGLNFKRQGHSCKQNGADAAAACMGSVADSQVSDMQSLTVHQCTTCQCMTYQCMTCSHAGIHGPLLPNPLLPQDPITGIALLLTR